MTLTGFNSEDFADHTEWFRDGRGVPVWFDPKNGSVAPEQAEGRQTLACQIAFCARFNRDTLEVETARYFHDADDFDVFAEDSYVSVPLRLIREVGLFLIPANRSWDKMLSFSSELFRRVIRSAGGLPAETVLAERGRLRNPDPKIEEDEHLAPIIDKVNREIERLVGRAAPLQMRLTPTDSEGVLNAVVPHFQAHGNGSIPSKLQGSGLISLQSLFLLLHFGQKRIADGESFLMALEEPELHLPPAVQRRVLARLQSLSTQTIVSTHSPLVAAYCEATSLLVVRNDDGELVAKPMLARALDPEAINAVRKLFQINRVETAAAVMNEFVLVPEGWLDYSWLNLLIRVAELDQQANDPCLFGVKVGVVPTSDAKVAETVAKLSEAHPAICALIDGDDDGLGYADALDAPHSGARVVLRWPDGWSVEDVLSWIVAADETAVIARLDSDLVSPLGDRQTLLARLKSDDRNQHGLKGDLVAYEITANALAECAPCRQRTRALLNAMASACAGEASQHFIVMERDEGRIPRLVFTP